MNIFEQNLSVHETVPRSIALEPTEKFPSKIAPIYESRVTDTDSGEEVGFVEFQLNHRSKTLIIQHISINKPKQGYGAGLYRYLQGLYPDFELHSSDQMNAKEHVEQEKPNAVYPWEKLVKEGLAEEDPDGGFRMRRQAN